MIDKTITRLIDAVSSQADDPRAAEALRQGVGEFASSLPLRDVLALELILQSFAEAAEELPASAGPLEIRDRSRELRERPAWRRQAGEGPG